MANKKLAALGLMGLKGLGADLIRRLTRGSIAVAGHDADPAAVSALAQECGLLQACDSLPQLVAETACPRILWLSLPVADATENAITELASLLAPGDLLVDGAEGHFNDAARRAGMLSQRGIGFVDVGVSGGQWGKDLGFALMLGGDPANVRRLEPFLAALAPAHGKGWLHCGASGAGHFVRTVQSRLERSMVGAFAEGLDFLKDRQDFNVRPADVAWLWRHGSSMATGLNELVDEFLIHAAPAAGGEAGFPASPAVALALMLRQAGQGAGLYMQQLGALFEQWSGSSGIPPHANDPAATPGSKE